MQHPQNFCHCRKHHRTVFLDLHLGWSDAIIPAVSFSKTRRKIKGPNQASSKGGGPQPDFLVAKNCHWFHWSPST